MTTEDARTPTGSTDLATHDGPGDGEAEVALPDLLTQVIRRVDETTDYDIHAGLSRLTTWTDMYPAHNDPDPTPDKPSRGGTDEPPSDNTRTSPSDNRRLGISGVARATALGLALLLAIGAVIVGIAYASRDRGPSYIAIARPVPIGAKISAADLTTVQLGGGAGLSAMPVASLNAVIGRYAAVTLMPGSLLVPRDVTNHAPVDANDAQIGIVARYTDLPSANLNPGDYIWLIPLSTNTVAGAQKQYEATIVDITHPDNNGNVYLLIAVPADQVAAVVTLNANGGLGFALEPHH